MINSESESTILKSITSNYVNLEIEIHKKVANGEKINVMIYEPSSNTSKLSLIRAFNKNELFSVIVFSHDNSEVSRRNYESIGSDVIYGGDVYEICLEKSIDIFFVESPHHFFSFHKPTYDFYTKIPERVFEEVLLCYVPYAYICIADDHPYNDHVHRYCWKFFVESIFHFKKAKAIKNRVDNVVLSGHPYLDEYYSNYISTKDDDKNVTILWAPHHNSSFYNGISLREQECVLRNMLIENDDVRAIFRPHPNLFGVLDSEIHVNSEDYNALITQDEAKEMKSFWENHDRVECSYKGSIVEFFEASDLIITNCGGFQMEMLHSNRIVINLINQNKLNEQLKLFQSYCYLPSSKDEFKSLVKDLTAKGNFHKPQRNEINRYLPDKGNAGESIVKHIENIFT